LIGLSHVALAGALAACLAGIGGFAYGTRVGEAQEQAAQKRADDAAEAVRQQLQGQIEAAGQRHQAAEYARQENVREITRESQKIIERPVYRDVCIDGDGALNLPSLRQQFAEVGIPIEVDRTLREALRSSTAPRFVADKSVKCFDGSTRRCWLFNVVPAGAEAESI